jgi:hypothetical protein
MKKEGLMVVVYVPPKSGNFSRGAALPNAPSTAHGARNILYKHQHQHAPNVFW